MTLEELMKTGDELFATHIIPGSPDWEALHDSTPEDTEEGEGEFQEDPVTAGDATTAAELLRRMEEAAAAGITDPDTAAAALAVAWLKGAGQSTPDEI